MTLHTSITRGSPRRIVPTSQSITHEKLDMRSDDTSPLDVRAVAAKGLFDFTGSPSEALEPSRASHSSSFQG